MEFGNNLAFLFTGLCCLSFLPLFTTIIALVLLLVKRRSFGSGVFLSGLTTGVLAAFGAAFHLLLAGPGFRPARDLWDLLVTVLPALYFGFGIGSLVACLVGFPIDLVSMVVSLFARIGKRILK